MSDKIPKSFAIIRNSILTVLKKHDGDFVGMGDELNLSRLKTQEARVEMLEKALGFYADEHSWQGLVHVKVGEWKGWDGTLMANDEGKIAEQALAASRALSSPNQPKDND